VLLTPNHSSFLDAPVMAAALDSERLRHTFWAAWTGFTAANVLSRAIARLARPRPIDQEHGAASGLAAASWP
jgi:long-chain acyl-CoA synthetase